MANLNTVWVPLPLLIMGGSSLIGGLVALLNLPETLGKKLPENMEDALNLWFDKRLYIFLLMLTFRSQYAIYQVEYVYTKCTIKCDFFNSEKRSYCYHADSPIFYQWIKKLNAQDLLKNRFEQIKLMNASKGLFIKSCQEFKLGKNTITWLHAAAASALFYFSKSRSYQP